MKNYYKVPCSWELYGHAEVEAGSWDEAIEIAESSECSLPAGEYIEGSFQVDHSIIEEEIENPKTFDLVSKVLDKSENL
tara:strand:- start:606 stop:842 length:237 start_codon:yes stop_codon:yes gene_type:complete